MKSFQKVFEPIKIGNLEIKNRIEFSPMDTCLATPEGWVTRELIAFYKARARGGAGIITVGDSPIDYDYAKNHNGLINLGDDRVIPGLSELAEAVQRYGAKISIELNHGGRMVPPEVLRGKRPVAPSPIPPAGGEAPGETKRARIQEMDQDMIAEVVEKYADAAYRCLRAGFEMVMLHGAHGHLLAQFLSPYSNKRTDHYGGSLENRARFPLEVLAAVRKRVGGRLAIEYRISATELVPGGLTVEETIEFLKMIEDKIDLVNVSVGTMSDPAVVPHVIQPAYFPHAYNVHYAEKIKKALRIPVVTVGSITDLEMADRIIADGKADLVAMARALIADPDLPNKTRFGRLEEVRPCVRCDYCGGQRSVLSLPVRCAVNPVTGRELEFGSIRPAEKKKKVVIVGGGPAGMEAAIVASSRGHQVTLYEKEGKLGGALTMAAAPPFKADMKRFLEWLRQATRRHPVEIKLSTEATPEAVKAEQPDVLILAAGATPILPDVPGVNRSSVVWAGDIHLDRVEAGEKVVVAGAGMTGCEAALHLAQQGKKVTLVDMVGPAEIARDMTDTNRTGLMQLLHKHDVEFRLEVKLEEVTERGVVVIDRQWERHEIPADTVVLSLGFRSRSEVVEAFRGLAPEVYVIGDCQKPRNLRAAIHDAFNVAVEI
ncbi:MAG: FAD-dependent oxidoreductase [Bacillota bacterium]